MFANKKVKNYVHFAEKWQELYQLVARNLSQLY